MKLLFTAVKFIQVTMCSMLILCADHVYAQEGTKKPISEHAGYLSKKFKLSPQEAETLVRFSDSTTKAMNEVYDNKNLSVSEKIRKLDSLGNGRRRKMKHMIPAIADRILEPGEIRKRKINN